MFVSYIEVVDSNPAAVWKVWIPGSKTNGELETGTPVNEQTHDDDQVEHSHVDGVQQEIL